MRRDGKANGPSKNIIRHPELSCFQEAGWRKKEKLFTLFKDKTADSWHELEQSKILHRLLVKQRTKTAFVPGKKVLETLAWSG